MRSYGSITVVSAIAFSLLFSCIFPPRDRDSENTDYLFYYKPVAQSILNNSYFDSSVPHSQSEFRYPPGFSVTLAGIFLAAKASHVPSNLLYRIFALICAAISAAVVFKLATAFWSNRIAMVVALVWASYPLWLWSLNQPASETPFVPLLICSILQLKTLCKDPKHAFVKSAFLGLLYGVLMLIRPIAFLLPVLGAVIMLVSPGYSKARTRISMALLTITTACIVVAPWELWLRSQTGTFQVLSNNGAYALYDGLTYAYLTDDFRQPIAVPKDVAETMGRIHEHCVMSLSKHSLAEVLTLEIRHAPVALCKLAVIKLHRCWYATNSHKREIWILALQAVLLIPCVSGMVLFFKKQKENKDVSWILIIHVLYFWGVTFLALSTVRYMVPIMPLLFVFLPGNFYLVNKQMICNKD